VTTEGKVKHRQLYKGWYCTYSPIRTQGSQWQARKGRTYLKAGDTQRLTHLIDQTTQEPS
jgi:hypothetical protein